jgi:hypothetical protein
VFRVLLVALALLVPLALPVLQVHLVRKGRPDLRVQLDLLEPQVSRVQVAFKEHQVQLAQQDLSDLPELQEVQDQLVLLV